MTRTHRIILFLIAMLAVGTFVFAILTLKGSGKPRTAAPAEKAAESSK
jgi:hypothetical protein